MNLDNNREHTDSMQVERHWGLVNKETGEVIDQTNKSPVDRSAQTLRKTYKGLMRLADEQQRPTYSVTLTLADPAVSSDAKGKLDAFLQALRRRQKSAYVWVCSLQPERSSKGDPVLHFHIAIASDSMPDKATLDALWKCGCIDCKPTRDRAAYGKYMENQQKKGSAPDLRAVFGNQRRFGSSRLGHYAFPDWAWNWTQEELKANPDLSLYTIKKLGPEYGFFDTENRPVKVKRSPWVAVCL